MPKNKKILRGRVLFEIIDNHIKQLGQSGLSIIDAATGYGKSYQAARYIEEKIGDKKFIFLTPQKKLFLKSDEIKNKTSGKTNICIEIKPHIDTFKEHFLSIKDDEIFKNNALVDDIRKIVCKLNNPEYPYFKETEKLFNSMELQFRRELREILKNNNAFKKHNDNSKNRLDKYDKSKVLSFFDKFAWIKKLYPAVLLPFADLVQMTIQKAYYTIDTLWFGKHELRNQFDEMFKDYVIFIDEFDSTKEALLSMIIKEVIEEERVDVFKTIEFVYTSVRKIINEESILPVGFFGGDYDLVMKVFKDYFSKLEEGFIKYKLYSKVKYLNEDKKERFLFRDRVTLDTIKGSEKDKLVVFFDESEKHNSIKLNEKGLEEYPIEEVTNFVFNQLHEFVIVIEKIAKNHFSYNEERKRSGDEVYSFFDSISTILRELHLGKENENYFVKRVYLFSIHNLPKNNIQNTDSFLSDGFQYFCMKNDPEQQLSTDVQLFSFNTLPEHVIVGMARNNIVVGLSATSTLQSYYKNYDFNYLNRRLKDSFIQINDEELEQLKENFDDRNTHTVNINKVNKENISSFHDFIDKVGMVDDYFKEKFEWDKVINRTVIDGQYSYRYNTYYNLTKVFANFCKKNIKGFIAFLNFNINNADELKFNEYKKQLEDYAKFTGIDCEILDIDSSNFENMSELKQNSINSKNVFIISSYKSLGLGKNLQYKMSDGKTEKDLDGIYLDNVSFLLPQIQQYSNQSLAEYLYAIQYLKSERIIKDNAKFNQYIQNGFRAFINGSLIKYDFDGKDMIVAKIAIQAIGRICRTSNKNNNVHLYVHENIMSALGRKKEILSQRMNNNEFNKLLDECSMPETVLSDARFVMENHYKHKYANYRITYLSYRWWNELKKSEWIKLRDTVLRSPTTNQPDTNDEYYYVRFEKPANVYSYHQKKLSSNFIEFYNISDEFISGDYSYLVGSHEARLEKILKSEHVSKYFHKHGYATKFERGYYVINPGTYQRVYKGALGEVTGRAILEGFGINLDEITEDKHFEKFDYFNGSVYFDFKHWSETFSQIKNKIISKISKKAITVGAKRIFIINVLKNSFVDSHQIKIDNGILYEIPWLYDSENNVYNEEAIELIRKEVILNGNNN